MVWSSTCARTNVVSSWLKVSRSIHTKRICNWIKNQYYLSLCLQNDLPEIGVFCILRYWIKDIDETDENDDRIASVKLHIPFLTVIKFVWFIQKYNSVDAFGFTDRSLDSLMRLFKIWKTLMQHLTKSNTPENNSRYSLSRYRF